MDAEEDVITYTVHSCLLIRVCFAFRTLEVRSWFNSAPVGTLMTKKTFVYDKLASGNSVNEWEIQNLNWISPNSLCDTRSCRPNWSFSIHHFFNPHFCLKRVDQN
jgi:hypothetical protein